MIMSILTAISDIPTLFLHHDYLPSLNALGMHEDSTIPMLLLDLSERILHLHSPSY